MLGGTISSFGSLAWKSTIRPVAVQHEHEVGNRPQDCAVACLELAEGLLGPLSGCDVAADALKLHDLSAGVEDDVIDPVVPADGSVRQGDLMLL